MGPKNRVFKNRVLNEGLDPHGKGQLWGLSRPLKNTGSLCCGLGSKIDHSIFNSGAKARLLQPTAMLPTDQCHITLSPVKNPPLLRCGLSSKFFDHLLSFRVALLRISLRQLNSSSLIGIVSSCLSVFRSFKNYY